MIYHKFRFKSIKENWNVLICKIFGHRINENPAHHWCERCGLAYEEAYYPLYYYKDAGINNPSTVYVRMERPNKYPVKGFYDKDEAMAEQEQFDDGCIFELEVE